LVPGGDQNLQAPVTPVGISKSSDLKKGQHNTCMRCYGFVTEPGYQPGGTDRTVPGAREENRGGIRPERGVLAGSSAGGLPRSMRPAGRHKEGVVPNKQKRFGEGGAPLFSGLPGRDTKAVRKRVHAYSRRKRRGFLGVIVFSPDEAPLTLPTVFIGLVVAVPVFLFLPVLFTITITVPVFLVISRSHVNP